ncbi:hypothetical protein P691DRAFT_691420 [Macrolepiota fuliginosa MF-IS2]|uniref:F-box domain-containing protein n=1 Tax=Macrolepiota fuliginosa MF-IS2 TaxID=1400762 RepID=A0A9P5XQJ1_9AGAR|nr:hypothetical protein P691DRAFT_691420 [Macrolepiota fuliginosa MF-IS2]
MSTTCGPRNAFLTLPAEMIDRILCGLDLRSLLKCKEVCKKLKTHIETGKEIQYIMELEIAGCVHNDHNTWSSAQRLDCLRKHQAAWEQLKWSKGREVRMLGGTLWELYGGILAQTDMEGTFHFLKLPSEIRHIEEDSWTIKPNIDNIRDFGIDPSQNLLVWVTAPSPTSPSISLHLRTLRTTENHPLARQPVIHYEPHRPMGRWHFAIRIMQDYIGLQAYRRSSPDEEDITDLTDFLVWNWKENKRELAVQTDHTQSFSFVSDRHVVLANHFVGQTLEITEPYLVLIDFKAEEETKKLVTEARHSMKLCYPDLASEVVVLQFGISCEPAPGWTPGEDDKTPFFISKDNRIFMVTMRIQQRGNDYAFEHFIPLSAFKKCIDHLDTSSGQQLKWSEWAPTDTRLIRSSLPASDVWVCFAYGSRSVGGEFRRRGNVIFGVVVYDFNQLLFRRNVTTSKDSSNTRIEKPGPIIQTDEIWTEPVKTSLPYSRYFGELPVRPGGYSIMCTADNLVLVDIKAQQFRIYKF